MTFLIMQLRMKSNFKKERRSPDLTAGLKIAMRIVKYNTLLNDGLPCLVKEKGINYNSPNSKLDNPTAMANMLRDVFDLDKQTEEYLYMICLSNVGTCLGIFEISHGTVNASLITPREVFLKATLCGAVMIVLAHNHPGGNAYPSTDDIRVTKQIYDCGNLMNISLADHIIVAEDNHYSFREHENVIKH